MPLLKAVMIRLQLSPPLLRAVLSIALVAAPCLPSPMAETAAAQVPASQLVQKVDIPYSEFRLKNGLRVIQMISPENVPG